MEKKHRNEVTRQPEQKRAQKRSQKNKTNTESDCSLSQALVRRNNKRKQYILSYYT